VSQEGNGHSPVRACAARPSRIRSRPQRNRCVSTSGAARVGGWVWSMSATWMARAFARAGQCRAVVHRAGIGEQFRPQVEGPCADAIPPR